MIIVIFIILLLLFNYLETKSNKSRSKVHNPLVYNPGMEQRGTA